MALDNFLAYDSFARSVLTKTRFVLTEKQRDFLRDLHVLSKQHEVRLSAGTKKWRAQRGANSVVIREESFEKELLIPFPASRMMPRQMQAKEGRMNPKGIPCLYVANSPEAAMSELRCWIGEYISLCECEILRDLRIVDCTGGFRRVPDGGERPLTVVEIEAVVWGWVCGAFSLPVSPLDDVADYAPTQIIAEYFKSAGYDGISYSSRSHTGGVSLALFDIGSAAPSRHFVFEVGAVNYQFSPYNFGDGCKGMASDISDIQPGCIYSSQEWQHKFDRHE